MTERAKTQWAKRTSIVFNYLVAFGRRVPSWLKKAPLFPVLVLFLFSLFLAGPVYGFVRLPSKERMTVRVIGTKNFGGQVIFDQEVEVRVGATAGEALEKAVEIDLAGSYVETIAGIKGDQTQYWFYYLNGVMANVFAHSYRLFPGDIQHWDFHDWTTYVMGPSAMTGYFPEPCLHGYGGKVAPTTIVYADGFQDYAQKLKEKLTVLGVREVVIKEASSLTAEEKERNNLFILAPVGSSLLSELNKHYQAREIIYFGEEKIIVRDHKGKHLQTYGPGFGVLQVIQNPWNPKGSLACEGVVWAVTGFDETGVKRAANVLIGQAERLKNTFAAVVGENQLIKVPVTSDGLKTISVETENGVSKQQENAPARALQAEKQEDQEDKVTGEQLGADKTDEHKQSAATENKNEQNGSSEDKQQSLAGQSLPDETNATGQQAALSRLNKLSGFWWVIPLLALIGAGAWWAKRKK